MSFRFRRQHSIFVFVSVLAGGALVGSACNKSKSQTISPIGPSPIVSISSVAIEGQVNLAVGQSAQLSAFATKADGTRENITSQAQWSVEANAIASIEGGGVVRALQAGQTKIVVTYQSVSGSTSLSVVGSSASSDPQPSPDSPIGPPSNTTPPAPIAPVSPVVPTIPPVPPTEPPSQPPTTPNPPSVTPTVTGLLIGGNLNLIVGGISQLTATATVLGAGQQDATAHVTWSSSNPAVATIAAGGVVRGVTAGSTTISASVLGVTATAQLNVALPAVIGLTITGNLSLQPTLSTALTAIATLANGTQLDVTAAVTWSSNNPLVATVSAQGVVHGLLAGLAGIGATYQGVSANVQLQVALPIGGVLPGVPGLPIPPVVPVAPLAPILESLSLTGPISVRIGSTIQLRAIAHYSDGTTEDVTASATWGASNSLLGGIVNGLLNTLGLGSINVTATYQGKSASQGIQITLL